MSEEFSYGRTVKPYPPYNVSTDLEDTTPEHIAGAAAVAEVNDRVDSVIEIAKSIVGYLEEGSDHMYKKRPIPQCTYIGSNDSRGEVTYKSRNRFFYSSGYSNLTPWANNPNLDEVSANSTMGNLYVTIRRMY